MGSEDVLERAERQMTAMEKDGWNTRIFRALAAEVRELRKDRERLDWLESCLTITTGTDHGCVQIGTCRSNIDAAMRERSDGVS